ncbi:MAG: hypothetical protein QOG43_367 [Actinomycetota bacterium]|jgi:nicotinamidase-related amidase|nr:hypothetical protein [Actinomycetota bacterium]
MQVRLPGVDGVPLGPSSRDRWLVSPATVDTVRERRLPVPVTVSVGDHELILDLGRAALIVVDMQNDFCTPGGWLDHIGVDVGPTRGPIDAINGLTHALRTLGVPVVWLNWGCRPDRANLSPATLHVYNGDGRGRGIGDPLPGSGGAVLTEGSWAAAIVDDLDVDPADIRVSKHRMSGFWDTPLDSILRHLDVTTALFGGVNADQCVLATLMDANFLGYDCVLLEDITATTSPRFCWDATLYNVRQCFGFVTTGAALIAAAAAG